MKRILAVVVALFALTAFADETKVETKKTVENTGKKKTVTAETKTTNDPGGMNNSVTDTKTHKTEQKVTDTGGKETTVENTKDHDAPGMKNDKKTTSKTKVVRDANGKVVEESSTTK